MTSTVAVNIPASPAYLAERGAMAASFFNSRSFSILAHGDSLWKSVRWEKVDSMYPHWASAAWA
jgi:hypothetical protein